MKTESPQEIKDSYVESAQPGLSEFGNCRFESKNINAFQPITNKCVAEEMIDLSTIFIFSPQNIGQCKSTDMFKKKEEGRTFQDAHFRSNMCTLQSQKVDGCSCVYCSLPPKNQEESIICQGFIPPRHDEDALVGEPLLTAEIDLKE